MKNLLLVFGFVAAVSLVTAETGSCKLSSIKVPDKWSLMVGSCMKKMKAQVEMEITASMTYLAMGTHFAQDTVNRPGFSNFFFKSASEEREHAIKLIEYLLMRGQLTSGINDLIKITDNLKPNATKWESGFHALKAALILETQVTDSIKSIMKECEEPSGNYPKENDFHLVDYLTTVYLEEQYQGQRDLAGKISTLGKMTSDLSKNTHGNLAEFLFDKKLLKGEV